MIEGNVSWRRIILLSVLGLSLAGIDLPHALRAGQSASKPAEKAPATRVAPESDEQTALNNAFRTAENNPQSIIKNLEAFLNQFPKSTRREAVLRTICAYALEANAPGVIAQYGQMLLEITPDDPKLLNMLIEAVTRQNDPASRARAIDYISRLLKVAQDEQAKAVAGGGHDTSEQWVERIAVIYAQRAGFYQNSGDLDKALADYEKSYATYANARVAEQLGDAAALKSDFARAMDYYLTAFVFPEKNPDPGRRQEVRRKLGSLYVEQHHSEKGLGDLVLLRYDALMPQLAGRFSGDKPQNTGIQDPFKFVLERADGTPLPMAGYHGKVLVVDFWATWCGPCRVQGQLVDQVAKSFRSDPNIVFLSLNMDEDRGGVPAFLKQAGWTVPMAYAQGLDQLLNVRELPTLVVFDRQGQIVYRENGLDPQTFVEDLSKRLREALQESAGRKQ